MTPEQTADQLAQLTATCTAQQTHINELYQQIQYINLSLETAFRSITELQQQLAVKAE